MVTDFSHTYREMSDDELLNAATQRGELLPAAAQALATELKRRNLSAHDVSSYAEYLRNYVPRTVDGKPLPVAQTWCGIGTTFYGKTAFRQDWSFVSTKWFVFVWIPIVPLSSARVSGLPSELLAVFRVFGRAYSAIPANVVLKWLPSVDRTQVKCIYGFVGTLFSLLWLLYLTSLGTRLLPFLLVLGAVVAFSFVPFALRRRALNRKMREPAEIYTSNS